MINNQFITSCILMLLGGIPGIHKLLGQYPPNWFKEMFKNSIIDIFPHSITFSFLIIIFLEILGASLFLLALLKKEYITKKYTYTNIGISTYLILFTILLFGSFIIENYDNGFKDFIYFSAIIIIKQSVFMNPKPKS